MSEKVKEPEVNLSDKELARANEFMHALEPYGEVAVVREMARRIQALDKSQVPMNTGEASHLAQLAIAHDLNPFSGEIWGWIQVKGGKRHFNWMPGRRGIVRHANEQAQERGFEWWYDEEEMTREEKKNAMIPENAIAIRVKVYDSATMEEWRKTFDSLREALPPEQALSTAGNPPCSVGIGVLTQEEISRMPRNNKMPHINRASKRGLMEALKHKFHLQFGMWKGGQTYDEYIVDKEGAIDVDFEDVTVEQKDRMNPEYWGDIPKVIVEESLAKDAFVASEILSYTPMTPQTIKQEWAIEFFQVAKDVYKENENLALKEVAEKAYRRWFGVEEEIEDGEFRDVEDEPEEGKDPFYQRLTEELGGAKFAKVITEKSKVVSDKSKEEKIKAYIKYYAQALEKGNDPELAVEATDQIVANMEATGAYDKEKE